jgi:hypothetical protein
MPLEVIDGTRPRHVECGNSYRHCIPSLGTGRQAEQEAKQQKSQGKKGL